MGQQHEVVNFGQEVKGQVTIVPSASFLKNDLTNFNQTWRTHIMDLW